jgi:DNA repair exonuclease SbcCD ATPase subunit
LKRERDRILQDFDKLVLLEEGKKIAWGKHAAVQEQLTAITGISKNMFEEFVWIQQEKLKEILNMRPGDRQKTLDEFFGLSSFQKAWENLFPYQKEYEGVRRNLESDPDLRHLADLKKQYEDTLSETIKLQVELETSKVELAEAEKRLLEAERQLRDLEDLEKRVNKLKEERSGLQAQIAETEAAIRRLEEEHSRVEEASAKSGEKLQQLRVQEGGVLTASSSLLGMTVNSGDELPTIIEKLESDVGELRNTLAQTRAAVEESRQARERIEAEKICPTCRRKIGKTHKERLSFQLREEEEQNLRKMRELTGKLEEAGRKLQTLTAAKNKLEILRVEIANAEAELSEKQQTSTQLKREIAEKEKSREKLAQRLREVDAQIGEFRVEVLESARKLREESRLRRERLLQSIQFQEKMIQEKNSSLSLLEERIKNAEQKQAQKRKAENLAAAVEELRHAYREVVPLLRRLYVESLRHAMQSVMDSLTVEAARSLSIEIDEEYTPFLVEASGFRRGVHHLSGGERTWLSLAYRVGLGQLITEARTGQAWSCSSSTSPPRRWGRRTEASKPWRRLYPT